MNQSSQLLCECFVYTYFILCLYYLYRSMLFKQSDYHLIGYTFLSMYKTFFIYNNRINLKFQLA